MTEQEILLVVGLAGLAVAITLGDLVLSLVRHWRRAARARKLDGVPDGPMGERTAVESGSESIGRRLVAIEAAAEESLSSSPFERRSG